jgi:RND family efflux transporter MFP subunit
LEAEATLDQRPRKRSAKVLIGIGAIVVALIAAGVIARNMTESPAAETPSSKTPSVSVAVPLQRQVAPRLDFLGQFSAVQNVELRAQVGGTLTAIHFKDGDIVHKGDLLFEIDPVPYQIKMSQATAQLESANAQLGLATRELARAVTLKSTDAGTAENVDQRTAEKLAAQAAVDAAKAQVRDAQFDLDHCRITAPFTGRIGTHLVSVGNLVAGSRAATSPTTLLTTLVSLDPIYLNFDMSESDYMTFLRNHRKDQSADRVNISLSDESTYSRQGTLEFVDNTLDRSSGTIHARAIVPNSDLLMTPGGFGRVRMDVAQSEPVLLVPDASVLPDQTNHIVLVVGPNNVVMPKPVQIGDLRDGLRVIRSGLTSTDRVIVDGIPIAHPGATVSPHDAPIRTASN